VVAADSSSATFDEPGDDTTAVRPPVYDVAYDQDPPRSESLQQSVEQIEPSVDVTHYRSRHVDRKGG